MGYQSGKTVMQCPFCKQQAVQCFHRPAYSQAKTSRISGGSKITYTRIPETYEVCGNCPNCGKTKREIQNFFDGKKEIPHEERIERLKKAGIPTRIEG